MAFSYFRCGNHFFLVHGEMFLRYFTSNKSKDESHHMYITFYTKQGNGAFLSHLTMSNLLFYISYFFKFISFLLFINNIHVMPKGTVADTTNGMAP